jgi:NAD(P)-dependent dehydrogenase (short-subunit alcohol dehydrogenase family)
MDDAYRTTAPGKVAIVTGASEGIGAGLVAGLRRRGYAVVGTARSIAASDDPDYQTLSGDIASVETADRTLRLCLDRFGGVDVLVNNAGVFIGKPFTEYTLEDFTVMTAVNLAGFFHLTQRVIERMAARGSGHVVNISTSLVDHAKSSRPAALAALTKGGLDAVTRSLAIEYAARGVRVNAVSLGVIRSHPDGSYDGLAADQPLGRLGEVSDVVEGILYLDQAGFVTGEILHIDGGQAAGG